MFKRTLKRLLNALLGLFRRIVAFFIRQHGGYPVSEPANRVRVERLLKGDFRQIDISTLLLFLRFRSFGGQTIVELGHFIAHAEERDRIGLTTDFARDYYFHLKFYLEHQDKAVELDELPANFPDIARFGFSRVTDIQIKQDTGLKRKIAVKILESVLRSLQTKADGHLTIGRAPTGQETSVLKCATGYFTGKELFSDEKLFKEFSHALTKNGLLEPSEIKAFARAKTFISLFAISVMHGCRVKLTDDWWAELRAGAYTSNNTATVWMKAQLPAGYTVSNQFFTTSIDVSDACDAKLFALSDAKKPVWNFPIELSDEKKKLVHLSS